MRKFLALLLYRVTLPCLFIAAFPAWIVKMLRRGGLNTPLGERIALYGRNAEMEPCGATHIHAVSVGETIIALKLIREWLAENPHQQFVLATGTATGHAVATNAAITQVRVAYSPLDFASMITRYLDRFEPSRIVLIEGELWPHLLLACRKRSIPISLVNARMSPRSTRRYRRFANWLRPFVSSLDAVATQEVEDESIWRELGVAADAIHLTGSIKFDPGSGPAPARRSAFQDMLDAFGLQPFTEFKQRPDQGKVHDTAASRVGCQPAFKDGHHRFLFFVGVPDVGDAEFKIWAINSFVEHPHFISGQAQLSDNV